MAGLALHAQASEKNQNVSSEEATAERVHSLVCASADPVHLNTLSPTLGHWKEIAEAEERRARSGAPVTVARPAALAPSAALEEALRSGGNPRPVLLRCVAVAAELRLAAAAAAAAPAAPIAALHVEPLAELVPALILCAAGHTDRIRLLPFGELEPPPRDDALAAWQEGDRDPFTHLALGEGARSARSARQSVRSLLAALPEEDARLDVLGRAAITARRALGVLRVSLATTVPTLAEQLQCSRPAAGDALERLQEIGVARELTGRGRDRVYAWRLVL